MFQDSEPEGNASHPKGLALTGFSGNAILLNPDSRKQTVPEFFAVGLITRRIA